MNRSIVALALAFALAAGIPGVSAGGVDNASEIAMLRNAAHGDDPGAQLLLGLAYLEGRYGLKPDQEKAVH